MSIKSRIIQRAVLARPLITHIMTVVTGSEASINAAKYAILSAKLYHCKLSAIYVVDTATIKSLTLHKIFIQEESSEYEKSLEANGNRYLYFVEDLARAKKVSIDCFIRKGAIHTEVLSAADEKKVDMIIIGGLDKDLVPHDTISHAYKEIIVHAKCSVLLVKEPNIDLRFRQE